MPDSSGEPTGTPARLLRMLALLQSRPDWTGPELADRLKVSTRTIRKDITRLRELGYPVDAASGVSGGYRLAAGANLPPLLLDDDEVVAVAVGLRTAACAGIDGIEETSLRAFAKIDQMLPSRLRRRIGALQTQVESLNWGGPDARVDSESLALFAQACRDSEQVRFDYADRNGTESRRLVEPFRLVNAGHRWYLVAFDVRREDWRTFRVDRTSQPRLSGARTKQRVLPAVDAATFVRQSISHNEIEHLIVALLHASRDHIVKLWPHSADQLEVIDDHACRYRATTGNIEWLAMRLAMLDIEFAIEEPPELTDYLRAVADRIGRALAG